MVTDLLLVSEHFTSRVNSTAQSGQKPSQTQSCEVCGMQHMRGEITLQVHGGVNEAAHLNDRLTARLHVGV